MATLSIPAHGSASSRVSGALRRGLSALGAVPLAIFEAQARLAEYNRLQALSDAQLASRGLHREDITSHVFRTAA